MIMDLDNGIELTPLPTKENGLFIPLSDFLEVLDQVKVDSDLFIKMESVVGRTYMGLTAQMSPRERALKEKIQAIREQNKKDLD